MLVERVLNYPETMEEAWALKDIGLTVELVEVPDPLPFVRNWEACAFCGRRGQMQRDHIIPKSRGGLPAGDNLQWLCGPCNRSKSSHLLPFQMRLLR